MLLGGTVAAVVVALALAVARSDSAMAECTGTGAVHHSCFRSGYDMDGNCVFWGGPIRRDYCTVFQGHDCFLAAEREGEVTFWNAHGTAPNPCVPNYPTVVHHTEQILQWVYASRECPAQGGAEGSGSCE